MKNPIIATTLVLTLALSACSTQNDATKQETKQPETPKTSSVQAKPVETQTQEKASKTAAAEYVDYSETKYNELLGKKSFALFFHAAWCPVCVGMEKEINSNLSKLPENITILKANYDKETELKKTYGIRSQSTVVIIDATGKPLKTLNAPTSDEIAAELK